MQTRQMTVLEAITTRRSIPQFKTDPVPKELIQRLLDVAVWVPNHRLTDPWQFHVLGEKTKRKFAETRRDFRNISLPNPDAPEVQPALQKIIDDTVNTPVIIIVTARAHRPGVAGGELLGNIRGGLCVHARSLGRGSWHVLPDRSDPTISPTAADAESRG